MRDEYSLFETEEDSLVDAVECTRCSEPLGWGTIHRFNSKPFGRVCYDRVVNRATLRSQSGTRRVISGCTQCGSDFQQSDVAQSICPGSVCCVCCHFTSDLEVPFCALEELIV